MMKTKFFYVAALILGLAFTTTSCSSDDDNPTVDPANIDYTPENASSWLERWSSDTYCQHDTVTFGRIVGHRVSTNCFLVVLTFQT